MMQSWTWIFFADALWHEQQLYKLYGKNADYFLHPKIETHEQVKKANPKLRRQGGGFYKGHTETEWRDLSGCCSLTL